MGRRAPSTACRHAGTPHPPLSKQPQGSTTHPVQFWGRRRLHPARAQLRVQLLQAVVQAAQPAAQPRRWRLPRRRARRRRHLLLHLCQLAADGGQLSGCACGALLRGVSRRLRRRHRLARLVQLGLQLRLLLPAGAGGVGGGRLAAGQLGPGCRQLAHQLLLLILRG